MERENRKIYEDPDCTLVWDIVNSVTEEVYFEYEDGDIDMIWSGEAYKKAETVFDKTMKYMQ